MFPELTDVSGYAEKTGNSVTLVGSTGVELTTDGADLDDTEHLVMTVPTLDDN